SSFSFSILVHHHPHPFPYTTLFRSGQSSPVQFRVLEHESPITAILAEAQNADLVLIGIGEEWGLESHVFSWRRQRIAEDCPTSLDRKSTRLNSSHGSISYAVFCLKK